MDGNSVYSAQPEEDPIGSFGPYDEPPQPKQCETRACNREVHRDSEGCYCASCEAEFWRDELKARRFESPPDPERTAHAEVQYRLWTLMAA